MKVVKYVPSLKGIRAVRSSREVDAHLEERARRVATQAEQVYASLGEDIPVDVVQEGSDTPAPRARVAVIARAANALQVEARHRVLGSSIDAARG